MPIVYILTNESMPDMIKIGFTERDLATRIKEFDVTPVPLPFECFYAVEVEDAKPIEALLHEAFDDKRVRQSREFFNCSPEQAKSALKIAETMGGKNVTPSEVIVDSEQDEHALTVARRRTNRINYFNVLGIEIGETLTFAKDKSIKCTVAENGQVKFRGELTSLSNSALILFHEMGINWVQVRGPGYWCYKGTTLLDLYQQTQNS